MRILSMLIIVVFIACNNYADKQNAGADAATKDSMKDSKDDGIPGKTIGEQPLPDTIFFGRGNEPFWYVAVIRDKKISFFLADEGKSVDFPYHEAKELADRQVFITQANGNELRLYAQRKECSDGMSDFKYPYCVDLYLMNRKYHGCGETATEKATK